MREHSWFSVPHLVVLMTAMMEEEAQTHDLQTAAVGLTKGNKSD